MYFAIKDIIGIKLDKNYKWLKTFSMGEPLKMISKEHYKKCPSKIEIKFSSKIDKSAHRDIGSNILVSEKSIIDLEYGAKILFEHNNHIILTVEQECNEWLISCVQFLFLQNNMTFIHAAALQKDNKVLLLPSWGGVGKTSTVAKLMGSNEWKLLGDDLVILDDKGMVLSFLKPFVLYPYHRPLFPNQFSDKEMKIYNLKINNYLTKCAPTIKRFLRHMPDVLAYAREHNPQSMRVSPSDIFKHEQLCDSGILHQVCWIERGFDSNVSVSEVDVDVMISKTLSVSVMEMFSSRLTHVLSLCGIGVIKYQDIFGKMENILKGSFSFKELKVLSIPVSVSVEDIGDIVKTYC